MVAGEDAETYGLGTVVQNMAVLFYAYDTLPTYLRLVRLQEALDVLMDLFGRAGLQEASWRRHTPYG